ncbi:methionine-r-sulfoxide reductase, putative, partial [Ichthyophthirius multifiliis]
MDNQFPFKVDKNELKNRLSKIQFDVTQNAATEQPFTGIYDKHFNPGQYNCVVCNIKLFNYQTKYDSGSGWPAFSQGVEENILEKIDKSHGMVRKEVLCKNCGAHLGHVFDDGSTNTQLRY